MKFKTNFFLSVSALSLFFQVRPNFQEQNYGLILGQVLEQKSFFKKEIENRLDAVDTFPVAIYDIYFLMQAGEVDDAVVSALIKKAIRKSNAQGFAQFKEKVSQLEKDYKLLKNKQIHKATFENYPDFKTFINHIEKEMSSQVSFPNSLTDLFLLLEHEVVLNQNEVGKQARELVYKKIKEVQTIATNNGEMEIYKPYVLEIIDKCLNMKYDHDLVWADVDLRKKLNKLRLVVEEKSKFKVELENSTKPKKEVYQATTAKKIVKDEPKKESTFLPPVKKTKKSSQEKKAKQPVKKRSDALEVKPKKEKKKKETTSTKPKKTSSKKKDEKKTEQSSDSATNQEIKPKITKINAEKNRPSLEKTKLNAKINKKRKRSKEHQD